MAIASLVLSWSRPKVREKRRASSLMPQKAEDERSKLLPSSDTISLNSCSAGEVRWSGEEVQDSTDMKQWMCLSLHSGKVPECTTADTYLLQAQDERFGTLDLVDLSRLAHRLLDDISIVVVILETEHRRLVRKI